MSFNNNHINPGGSTVTRDNYEEFFLLYVDNELNATEREAVELFVQQNPDLEEELVMLMQTVVRPDEQMSFAGKETLLKNIPEDGLINHNNCEEYFVLYADNELTNKEKELVEQFVYKHPQYQGDFELIQQVKLAPDNSIVFPSKQDLYRSEEDDRKVVPIRWWRMAVAAAVLLFMGTAGWYISSTREGDTGIVNTTPVDTPDSNTTGNSAPAITNGQLAATKDDQQKTGTEEDKQSTNRQRTPAIQSTVSHTLIATVDKQKKNIQPGSNIPATVSVTHKTPELENNVVKVDKPPVIEKRKRDVEAREVTAAIVETPTLPPATVLALNDKQPGTAVQPSEIRYVDAGDLNPDETIYVANTSVNKNPLRGFFRKASRVFDKATSMESGEETHRKGIRIASFEIALK